MFLYEKYLNLGLSWDSIGNIMGLFGTGNEKHFPTTKQAGNETGTGNNEKLGAIIIKQPSFKTDKE